MIPNVLPKDDPKPWKHELKNASLSLSALLRLLNLRPHDFALPLLDDPTFKIKATAHYLHKIKPKQPRDPLLLQILPFAQEQQLQDGFVNDPVGDLAASAASGLIQKYHGRALLLASSVCPIHCRYCFRQHFPYQEHRHLKPALSHLAKDTSIREIILSGGDPLSLDNQKLATLLAKLENIPHLKTLRIHSRYPSILPARFDAGLIDLLSHSRFKVVLVSHVNHPQEIDFAMTKALQPLRDSVTLLNQSVLLKGINDNTADLIVLSHRLFDTGILPYYLHQLDKTQGAGHFEVTDIKAKKIITQMKVKLPGYLVPKLVQEITGTPHKTEL